MAWDTWDVYHNLFKNNHCVETVVRSLCQGLPEQLVSDNGPQFTSEEFTKFMRSNGIKHIRCSPYHPSSNGAVERLVRTFKQAMKASHRDHLSPQQRLENFLLSYRTTPHATTGKSPCTLFLGYQTAYSFGPDVTIYSRKGGSEARSEKPSRYSF